MSYIILGLLVLIAVFGLLALIGLVWSWVKGVSALIFPGLGLVIATPLILLVLAMIEAALLFLIAFLWRG